MEEEQELMREALVGQKREVVECESLLREAETERDDYRLVTLSECGVLRADAVPTTQTLVRGLR